MPWVSRRFQKVNHFKSSSPQSWDSKEDEEDGEEDGGENQVKEQSTKIFPLPGGIQILKMPTNPFHLFIIIRQTFIKSETQ